METRSQTQRLPACAKLTLLAPIRRGTIDNADGLSYLGRLKQLLRTLKSAARIGGTGAALVGAPAESGESTPPGHVLDLTLFEPEHKLRLELVIDPPPRVWLPALSGEVGALLDLILCNCKGYVATPEPAPDLNAQWMHAAQAEAQFFSSAPPALIESEPARLELERLHREDPDSPTGLVHLRLVLPRRSADPRRTVESHPLETVKQGLQLLAVLHRLAELYPAQGADGALLLRTAHDLLRELRKDAIRPLYAPGTDAYKRFAAAIRWFDVPSSAG